MKKEIRQVSEDGKIVQITLCDERFYIETDDKGNMIEYPSCTWILSVGYPKGTQFYKWLASKGWDEAEAIKIEAGNRGSKVHLACADLILGNTVTIESQYPNSNTGNMEEITWDEWEGICSFKEWCDETKPKFLDHEFTVFNKELKYAGTVDLLCDIEGETWIIDLKTSAEVYPSFEAQLSAYKHAMDTAKHPMPKKLGILQLGYKRNKTKKWKFTEVEDQFELFTSAYNFWKKEYAETKLFKKDFPTSLSL